jgi:ACS family hexuronate transporter-like MFS transporter
MESMIITREGNPWHRWVLCALLFFATTINYVDRQLLGILAPILQREVGWNEAQYGFIVTSFQAAYALGLLLFGRIIDRVGSRVGLLAAVTAWSVASMAHGMASSAFQFAMARFGLGLAEAGNFPASVKMVSETFPPRERAFAIGIFNSGSNIGAIVTPLAVPILVGLFGWRITFYVTGLLGLLWVVCALPLMRPLGANGVALGMDTPWPSLLRDRRAWAFGIAKLMTDPIWWFYLYWAPKYFGSRFGVELSGLAMPLVCIYVMADLGSVFGGWGSGRLVKRGWSPLGARRGMMALCALSVLVVGFAPYVSSIWAAAALLAIAAAAHQGWSANLFAMSADLFPRQTVASVVGFGGMLGALGGMVMATATGLILEYSGSYTVPFVVCACAYIVAWCVTWALIGSSRTLSATEGERE